MNRTQLLLRFIALICLLAALTPAQAQQYSLPKIDSRVFLPVPPTDSSASKMVDYYLYFYAKRLRTTANKPRISMDQHWTMDSIYKSYAVPFGILVNSSNCPRCHSFITNGMYVVDYGDKVSKTTFQRIRPAVRFYETTFGIETLNYLNYNTSRRLSYPSSHSLRGFGLGMLMGMIANSRIDTLLYRGWDFGQSRVIGGAHWFTDVEASRLIASVNASRIFCDKGAISGLELAKEEYRTITGAEPAPPINEIAGNPADMQRAVNFISVPPLHDDSPILAWDRQQYTWGRTQRDTPLAQQAVFDSDLTSENIGLQFENVYGVLVSEAYTPVLYNMLEKLNTLVAQGCDYLATQFNRTRPCVLYGDSAAVPESRDLLTLTSSYPSRHAAMGWATGLLLNAVNSENIDSVMLKAYQYGSERVIAGTNWQSDIDAGRRVGIAAFTLLASASDFSTHITRAQLEDLDLRGQVITKLDKVVKPDTNDTPLFTIYGRPATDDSRGVLVGRNTKILRP